MTTPKLTPWFPSNVKPARQGVYQRMSRTGDPRWARWTGKYWACYSIDKDVAAKPALGFYRNN